MLYILKINMYSLSCLFLKYITDVIYFKNKHVSEYKLWLASEDYFDYVIGLL